jgi:hypothetical protein
MILFIVFVFFFVSFDLHLAPMGIELTNNKVEHSNVATLVGVQVYPPD